jgi:DNA adenine methylase
MMQARPEIRRPALRYFGGKWMLAPWILSFFPQHDVYVEPFGGAASVLLRKPRAKVEIYNDLDSEVVNVFRVLRDPVASKALASLLLLTPFAREEFRAAYEPSLDPVERARRMICLSLMGIGADAVFGRTSGFRSKAMDRRNPALDWQNYPREVAKFCERLAGVTIESRPAHQVMRDFDTPKTLHYVDPPYMHGTRRRIRRRNYRHELTDACHAELLKTLAELKGMVVLSGYKSAAYESLGWKRCETEALADGAGPRTERLA